MKYEYLNNTPLDEAKKIFLQALTQAGCRHKTERIQTRDALGRVTAAAVYARRCTPHYCASAMDGIAVLAARTEGASENMPMLLRENEFVRVDTGDALPPGTDCVIMVENLLETDDGAVCVQSAAVPWQNVRQIGEDSSEGDMLAPSYTRITPALLGAFLAAGVFSFEAVKQPLCGILPTGDELVATEHEPFDGEIPEFNSAVFAAMLHEWGVRSRVSPIIPDDPALLTAAVREAACDCDLLLVLAGSSAGRDDYTSRVLQACGTLILHGVAVKPGKPAVLGHIGTVPVVGLPGYPVSGIVVMRELVAPVVSMLTCLDIKEEETVQAVVSKRIVSSLKYTEFIRCRTGLVNGHITAVPMSRGAGILTGFAKATGMLRIPQNAEGVEAGETATLSLLQSKQELSDAVCVIGSHDPLLDEITDLLRRRDRTKSVTTGHVGSMGGIMAVKRGEAHLGGIHLLDEKTGVYNTSFLRTYFPEGGVRLLRCVRRVQGLMVQPGNPKGIVSLRDLADRHLSYVNRQKGSGTRLLLEYLLKTEGIDPALLYGYTREENTHTAVAAIVASGSADAGLGIYSAAKLYGLAFIPLWNEAYDLLVAENAFALPQVRAFLDILASQELRGRLTAMGGYLLDAPGTEIDWRNQ